MNYKSGPFNDTRGGKQRIRIGDGCPHGCPWCKCPRERVYHGIPEITSTRVQILDMNLLSYPNVIEILENLRDTRVDVNHFLRKVTYEAVCGFDHRFLTREIAALLRAARFEHPRVAWDGPFHDQRRVKRAIDNLRRAGFTWIGCFMICNHPVTTIHDNRRKLELLKIWNVRALDCWYDGQSPPDVKPRAWSFEECKQFRQECRHHNQLVHNGFDPEAPRPPEPPRGKIQARLI